MFDFDLSTLERWKNILITRRAGFAAAGIPNGTKRLEAYFQAEIQLQQAMLNIMRYTYADTAALHGAVCGRVNADLDSLGFLRELATIKPEDVTGDIQHISDGVSGRMFLEAVQATLERYDALPSSLQYLVAMTMPTQETILTSLMIAYEKTPNTLHAPALDVAQLG